MVINMSIWFQKSPTEIFFEHVMHRNNIHNHSDSNMELLYVNQRSQFCLR